MIYRHKHLYDPVGVLVDHADALLVDWVAAIVRIFLWLTFFQLYKSAEVAFIKLVNLINQHAQG